MSRTALATAVLVSSLSAAQPVTYPVPIAVRSPTSSPLPGTGAIDVALWLSNPGDPVASSLLFGVTQGTAAPFVLGTLAAGQVTSMPSPVDGIASTPGVVFGGPRYTLLAVSSGGTVVLGTLGANGAFMALGNSVTGSPPLALGTKADGGATLLVSDPTHTALTRYDVDPSAGVTATQGLTIFALTEPARSLVLDGPRDLVVIGGNTLGNLYLLDARLDAGPPTLLDAALVSQGRLAPPVTGLALYEGRDAGYLLVTSPQGVTVYDLLQTNPLPGAFRLLPSDTVGQLSGPTGIAVTNLPAGPAFPQGVIALGDPTARGLAMVRWDDLSARVDGGLVIDTTTDPRGPSPGSPDGGDGGADAGVPDAGGGGGGGPGGPGVPPGPGIPVDHSSSCASASGTPGLLALLSVLVLVIPGRRRQRR